MDIHNVLLAIMVLLTYGWILLAAYYLPPRGVDDLAYHLPPIFEYIQSHEIKLLPVALRPHFAFPENAELLFMWPTLFARNQRMIDSLNVPFVFMSTLTIYGLLRFFDTSRKNAMLASLLFALCPVVIMQAGVNYIDIPVTLFLLLNLYFALLFHASRRAIYLIATGTAIGMMLGMKYTALLLAIPLQLLVVPGLFNIKRRYAAGYVAAILVLCGWWYLRNTVVLNDPFYPLNLLGPLFGSPGGGGMIKNIIANAPHWTSRYLIEDIGIGTYDGGFGLVFWGLGFSSWLYFTGYSLLHPSKTGLSRFMVLAYIPIGFILLLAVPEADVRYTGRLALFVVPVGLFSLCETIKVLQDKAGIAIIKMTCTVLSIVTLSLLFVSDQPTYRLSTVFYDKINQNQTSDFKYLMQALPSQAALRFIWEPLDFLTKDDSNGLRCYITGDFRLFAPAPVYGSNLQNHVLYSCKQSQGSVDAFIFTSFPNGEGAATDMTTGKRIPPNIRLSDETTSYDILANSDYKIVSHSNLGCLLMRASFFQKPEKQQLLRKYYLSAWPDAVALATQIEPVFTEHVPIMTSSPVGYGLRYVDMLANRTERILMIPENMEETVASLKKIEQCYTFNRPISGYLYREISHTGNNKAKLTVYLNRKP